MVMVYDTSAYYISIKTGQFIYFLSLEQMLVEHFNKKRISFPTPYLYIPKL